MPVKNAVVLFICSAGLIADLGAQSAKVVGTASERSGTPLAGVRVTVKVGDSQGPVVDRVITNGKGYYESKAALGPIWVECEAVAESDATVYSDNPVHAQLKIDLKSNPGRQDCVFDPVTVADSYWEKVAARIRTTAAHSPNQGIVATKEWSQIDGSNLPPVLKRPQRMHWVRSIGTPRLAALVSQLTRKLTRQFSGTQRLATRKRLPRCLSQSETKFAPTSRRSNSSDPSRGLIRSGFLADVAYAADQVVGGVFAIGHADDFDGRGLVVGTQD